MSSLACMLWWLLLGSLLGAFVGFRLFIPPEGNFGEPGGVQVEARPDDRRPEPVVARPRLEQRRRVGRNDRPRFDLRRLSRLTRQGRTGRGALEELPPRPRWYTGRMSDRAARSRLETTGFADAVHGRSSVRRYASDPVPHEDVEAMVGIAVRAANAGNAQTWRFIAVEDAALRGAMGQAVDEVLDEMGAWPEAAGMEKQLKAYRAYATFFAEAPMVIAVLGRPYHSLADELHERRRLPREERDRLRQRPDLQSLGAAVQLLCNAAHAMGYGSCWMTAPVVWDRVTMDATTRPAVCCSGVGSAP